MRLWTLHPHYLDARGLVALWREALLAQKVLRGETRGYTAHPQLLRFRTCEQPLAAIASYLQAVHEEAVARSYSFDHSKIAGERLAGQLSETEGQLRYEWQHLCTKLRQRAPQWLSDLEGVELPDPHPLFVIVPGGVRDWERR